jgi:hypothetical protein
MTLAIDSLVDLQTVHRHPAQIDVQIGQQRRIAGRRGLEGGVR